MHENLGMIPAPTPIADLTDMPFLMSPQQVAEVGVKTVNTLMSDRYEGRGLPFVKIGRSVRYRKQDVIAYINAHTFRSTKEAASSEVGA